MDDFSAQPGALNSFRLVGGDANAVEPLQRALSSMSPTFVLNAGEPVNSVGAAGGPKIITQVVMAIVHRIDGKRTLVDALQHPQLHHQWLPNKLVLEKSFDPGIRKELSGFGHEIVEIERAAVVQAIERTTEGDLIGVADPRVPGKAIGL